MVGTKSSTLIDNTKFPSGTQLVSNYFDVGTSYLFKFIFTDAGDATRFIPHGWLASVPFIAGFMWYNTALHRLFVAAAEAQISSYFLIRTQDNNATGTEPTTVVTLSGQTSANYLYAGHVTPFGGLAWDVDHTNGNASTLSGEYWNGSAWVALAGFVDGTKSGATLAKTWRM
jgi:hypothetical protein